MARFLCCWVDSWCASLVLSSAVKWRLERQGREKSSLSLFGGWWWDETCSMLIRRTLLVSHPLSKRAVYGRQIRLLSFSLDHPLLPWYIYNTSRISQPLPHLPTLSELRESPLLSSILHASSAGRMFPCNHPMMCLGCLAPSVIPPLTSVLVPVFLATVS